MCFRRAKTVNGWKARSKAALVDLGRNKLESVIYTRLLYIPSFVEVWEH